MDSWFERFKTKLSKITVSKSAEEAQRENELRRLKELELQDTLRKLNQDEILTDDEIARCCESGIVTKPTPSFDLVKKTVNEEQGLEMDKVVLITKTDEPAKSQPQTSEPSTEKRRRRNYLDDYDTPEFWD